MGGKNAFAGLGKTVVCAGIEIDSPLVIQALIGAQYRQVLQHVESNGKRLNITHQAMRQGPVAQDRIVGVVIVSTLSGLDMAVIISPVLA